MKYLALETKLRKIFDCERFGLDGRVDAGYIERHLKEMILTALNHMLLNVTNRENINNLIERIDSINEEDHVSYEVYDIIYQ